MEQGKLALKAILLAALTFTAAQADAAEAGKEKDTCKVPANAPECPKCGQSSPFDGAAAAQCAQQCQALKQSFEKAREELCKGQGGGQASLGLQTRNGS